MKSVVIIQEHLPHYRVGFYEELYKLLEAQGCRLKLVYSPNTANNLLAGSLDWATPIPIQWFHSLGWQNVFGVTKNSDLVIFQQESKYLANYFLQAGSMISKQKVAFWGHGRNFQSESASILGERIKRFASIFCDWWFAYNDLSAAVVRDFGFPAGRITSVQNSIDTRLISQVHARTTPNDLQQLRSSLGITSENVAVFTGGLYREKRLPFLFEACGIIRKSIPDFELLIIGKGPEAGFVSEMTSRHAWVHFVGPKSDEEKVPYWMLSKVLLMPGLVGLVVLDSFALGVPMITTDYPYHSPEISYLQDGVNGLVVSPWPDPIAYAERTIQLLKDPDRLLELQKNALADAERYSVQKMAENFAGGIHKALEAPKLSRATFFFKKGAPAIEATSRVGITIRSMSPYLRDFYDCFPQGNGQRVRVFIGQRGSDWVNPWDSALMLLRRTDHVFVNGQMSRARRRTILPSAELFNALENYRPTVLLVNEYSPLCLFAALWAIVRKTPWIVATDIGPDYADPYPRLGLRQKIMHYLANRSCTAILALTPSAVKRATQLGKKFLLCPHAIDTTRYVPRKSPARREGPVRIISIGNFIYRKGYDLLLQALAKIPNPGNSVWELECFGAGPANELLKLARDLNISACTRFSSFVGLDELIAAYQHSDIFVSASRADTYGVVVHEAASCGLPLVISKYCGASSVLVEESKNGFVVDPADSGTFANRLEKLIQNPHLRIEYGQRSRVLAEQWDVRKNAEAAAHWLKTFEHNPQTHQS